MTKASSFKQAGRLFRSALAISALALVAFSWTPARAAQPNEGQKADHKALHIGGPSSVRHHHHPRRETMEETQRGNFISCAPQGDTGPKRNKAVPRRAARHGMK